MTGLRVLSLSTLFPSPKRPGFGKFVEYSLGAVAARGDVDLTIVNPIGVPPWPLSLREPYHTYDANPAQGELNGTTVHYPRFTLIPRVGAGSNARRIAAAVLPLIRRLHAERPFDLIDAQFFYPDGPAVAIIARELGLPWTIKARGADIHFWGGRPAPLAQMRDAATGAAGLLAVSKALGEDMAALGMPADRVRVHYTGIDHQLFRPLPRKQARALISAVPELGVWVKGHLIVTTGALIPRKGQRLVIEALAAIPDTHLAFAGTGPDEAELRALAQHHGVADRVQFLGQVSHDLLPQVLSAADVLVLPSASEGIANAWIEALACGTPIVVPDIGGAREVLSDPAAGRIVPRNAGAIAAAVNAILADQPTEEAVSASADRFSWDRNATELVAFWNEMAGRT